MSKASSHDLNAFKSPNFPPLVNGKYDADQVLSLATDRSHVTSGNRHRGELERRHQTNQPTQIQSASTYVTYCKLVPLPLTIESQIPGLSPHVGK